MLLVAYIVVLTMRGHTNINFMKEYDKRKLLYIQPEDGI